MLACFVAKRGLKVCMQTFDDSQASKEIENLINIGQVNSRERLGEGFF